jgi:dihydrofolate synthase / folylpolyglutamate synthase
VLVAGSNGKGSTAALIASMARAAGYRTGLYTSPHLERVEERLRLDGRAVAGERLAALLAELVGLAERRLGSTPTYFEALTVAAFLWFAAERVDLAVVEVGMGGRLDATNLCEPVLSLITSISLEHREHLGETLAAIAREKAGILRRGRPAALWIEEPEAAQAVREAAGEIGAELHAAQAEVAIDVSTMSGWMAQDVCLLTPERRYELRLPLLGEHQARNLGLAVRAAELLSGLGFERLAPDAVAAGAASCRWPGRLEVVDLPGGRRVVLDAAHNSAGTQVLAAFLDRLASARDARPAPDLVFGVLGDKDAAAMLALLAPRVRHLVLTAPQSPRSRRPEELVAALPAGRAPGHGRLLVEAEPAAALDQALALGGDTLLVCGSIFLVGEIRGLLRQRFGLPPPACDLV